MIKIFVDTNRIQENHKKTEDFAPPIIIDRDGVFEHVFEVKGTGYKVVFNPVPEVTPLGARRVWIEVDDVQETKKSF